MTGVCVCVCFLPDRKNIIEKGMELSRHTNLIGEEVLCMTNHVYSARELGHSVVSDSLPPHGLQPARLLVHGILQARILEWVAILCSRGSSQPRGQT